jgi:hypothetical protein
MNGINSKRSRSWVGQTCLISLSQEPDPSKRVFQRNLGSTFCRANMTTGAPRTSIPTDSRDCTTRSMSSCEEFCPFTVDILTQIYLAHEVIAGYSKLDHDEAQCLTTGGRESR